MLVLACLLIQTHDVTKSPLSCFVTLDSTAARRRPAAALAAPCELCWKTLTRFRSSAPSRVRVRAWRPAKEKVPSPGPLVTW